MSTQNNLTVDSMASVLNATHQNKPFSVKTLYSVVYDIQNLHIYLYYDRQFNDPYVFDVKEELVKTKGFRKVALNNL